MSEREEALRWAQDWGHEDAAWGISGDILARALLDCEREREAGLERYGAENVRIARRAEAAERDREVQYRAAMAAIEGRAVAERDLAAAREDWMAEADRAEKLVRELDAAREALEEILNLQPWTHYAHPWNFDKRVRRIARAALRSQEAGE